MSGPMQFKPMLFKDQLYLQLYLGTQMFSACVFMIVKSF